MFDWNQFFGWFSVVFLVTAIPVAAMIIFEKRSPYKTVAWIMLLVLVPVLGLLFYLVFGQEYRKQKMYSRRGLLGLREWRRIASHQLRSFDPGQQHGELKQHEHLIRLMLNNSDALLTTGNKLEILKDGNQTFPAMIEAIEKAEHHIHLEYYIFDEDKIGKRILEILQRKHEEGVEVRIIVDDVGSWSLNKKFFNRLRRQGIEIFPFMEVRFPRLTSKANHRNHRKITVVDGKVGFIGGMNIADRYANGDPKLGHWRDTHLKITGDAAASLQVIFAADWFFVSRKELLGRAYFPRFSEMKGIPVQICAGGPDHDWEGIAQAFFSAISNARKRVHLVTPYLMPPPPLLEALKTAALSKVDVRIIIPQKSDARLSQWCSFSYVEELLEAGVHIFFYQKGFIHSKYMLADDSFSTIGTSNFDFRSFETNFEANAFIYDRAFTKELEQHFLEDQQHCREIKLTQWRKRPLLNKTREALAHIVSPMF